MDAATDTTTASVNEYSFFDEAIIYVRAGSGGQGSNTYKRMLHGQQGLPDGGNGGGGGDVVLEVDASLNTLAGLTTAWRPNAYGGSGAAATTNSARIKSFRAENGADGERSNRFGRAGKGEVIRVPPGTVIEERIEMDVDDDGDGTEEVWAPLGSLSDKEETLVVATGGEGGEGTAVQGKNRGVRRPRLPSTGGERKTLKLTLKIVADVALVGVPNAGEFRFVPFRSGNARVEIEA
jgi:GTP-binding protein